MTRESMVERVAQAIFQADCAYKPSHGDKPIILARAAIAAMREPTEAMIEKADGEFRDDDRAALIGEWQAMIDAALSE